MSLPDFRIYGELLFRLQPDKPGERSMEIHKLSQRWQAPSRKQFKLHDAPDGWPNMRIMEIDPTEEIEGVAYDLRLECEGILDDRTWIETGYEEELPEEGWDTLALNVYTRAPQDARWRKGSRIEMDTISGVTGAAASSKFNSPEHGFTTGQTIMPDFVAGFGGLTTGNDYFVCRLNANQFYLAASKANAFAAAVTAPAAAVAITGSQSSNRIAWTAHGLSDGAVVTFPTLTGGSGLTAATVPYYVISSTTDDFQLALTPGGAVVLLVTDVTAGICSAGSAILLTSDGASMRVRPIKPGFELCWITERRKRKARAKDYWELDLQLKGLKQEDDDSKLIKRRISTTGQTMSNDRYNGQTFSNMYTGFPPQYVGVHNFAPPVLGTAIAAEFDLPQISVTDTMISTAPPPTELVPGYWVPNDPPTIIVFSAFSDDYTYHCPSGWKVLSLQSEQLPGKPLWLLTITWGYQMATSPRTSPAA